MDEVVNGSAQIHDIASWLVRFDDLPRTLIASDDPVEPAPAEAAEEEALPEELAQTGAELETLRLAHEELLGAFQNQQRDHEAQMEQARREWAAREGDRLAARLVTELATAVKSLRRDLCRVLTPFLSDEIRDRAVCELEVALRHALVEAPVIHAEGPRDLLERLAETLSKQQTAELVLIERETVDISIDLAGARLETRLEDWMRSLRAERSEER